MRLFTHHVLPGRSPSDLLYELILKAGLPLTARVDTLSLDGLPVYSLPDGGLLICLADTLTQDNLRALIARAPQRVLCLDKAFHGNDALKTNAVLEMKSHGIEFHTV